MPAIAHKHAHRTFSDLFTTWHRRQESRLLPMGAATIQGITRKKCPDSAWKISGRQSEWPTILVEAAWSESKSTLKQDVLFWLQESEQEVKVVLTMKITPKGSITIERWILKQEAESTFVEPIQTMRLIRNIGSNQPLITGSMHIQFEDCFLRPKRKNETDFILSNDDLTEIAEAVWSGLPK
ncbi:hypothetical protein N7463_010601 [Penicillium fimorum]|uniref:Uncharacterized protein n=1 Tax=Penicillium fimorum TaxID=1882269 RepID=A0A9X0C1Z2_9EURO|nr:hypothetical protein N7463_010601 [Penicillium fimorum]